MILWTTRHTKPYNPNDVCYGRLDFDVSPTFEEESDGALKALLGAGAKPTRMFTSPLLRCLRLAEKAEKATGLSMEKREEMAAWARDLRGYKFKDGECFYDIDRRVQSLLDTLDDNGEFLWITHAGVIAALQHFACGLPDEQFVEGAFSYAMVTRFEFKRDAEGHFRGTFEKIHDGIQMQPLKIG